MGSSDCKHSGQVCNNNQSFVTDNIALKGCYGYNKLVYAWLELQNLQKSTYTQKAVQNKLMQQL